MVVSFKFKPLKTCHWRMFSGTRKDGLSVTRESAALQRAKRDERPSPPSPTRKFNKYGTIKIGSFLII